MKKQLTILALLLATTGIFAWAHSYYKEKHVKMSEKAVVMEYRVLDSDVWTLEQREKMHLLSKDASFDAIRRTKKEAEGAKQRSEIGFWIAMAGGIASAGYGLYVLWLLIVVELISKRGYRSLFAKMTAVAQKMGSALKLPKKS